MIDLRDFYLSQVMKDEYYFRFYDLVNHVNDVFNIIDGDYSHNTCTDFFVFDVEDAISKFRELCQPEISLSDKVDKCWFFLISYYLMKEGYAIKEFPRLLERPPQEPRSFTYNDIRNWIIRSGDNDGNIVTYAMRRLYIEKLTFVLNSSSMELNDALKLKILEISNRHASFEKNDYRRKTL